MKIRSKIKSLLSGQHFPKSIGPSRANSHANSRYWAKIELNRDFMPVLVMNIRSNNEIAVIRTTFSPQYVWGRLNGKYLLCIVRFVQTIKLVYFMGFHISCNSDKDLKDQAIANVRTTFSKVYEALKCG